MSTSRERYERSVRERDARRGLTPGYSYAPASASTQRYERSVRERDKRRARRNTYALSTSNEDVTYTQRENNTQIYKSNASQTDNEYYKKYSGMNYAALNRALSDSSMRSDEREWLANYRDTQYIKTEEDYDALILQKQERLEWLNEDAQRYATLTEDGYTIYAPIHDDEIKEIKKEIEELEKGRWRVQNEAKYSALSENDDFAQLSVIVNDKPTTVFGIQLGDTWLGIGDPRYDYINDIDGTRRRQQSASLRGGGTNVYSRYDYMEPDEIANYNYLYQAVGEDAANEYLDYLEYDLDARRMGAVQTSNAKFADEMPGLASVLSIPASLLGGTGYLDVVGQNIKKDVKEFFTGEYAGPINYNTVAMTPAVTSSTIRGTVAEDINERAGVIALDEEEHPILSRIFNGKGWGDVYQLGMSMLDSGAVALLYPLIGSAGVAFLGGNAATMGVLDAVRRGATDEQALMIGTLNGAFEMLFEEISIENLWKGDPHSLVNAIFKQGAIEGTEESFTSISNTVADILVMAQDSNHEQKIQGYVAQGLSVREARRQAFLDAVIAVAWDYVGGMISGGLMGGGKYAGTQAINWVGNRYNNDTNIERDGFYEFGREETSGTQGTHREVVWSETGGADGGRVSEVSAQTEETRKIINSAWSSGTNQAAQIISDFDGEYVVEPDEQIRAHVNGPAYTSNGVIHLSDKIDADVGVTIGNHERIHQLKQQSNIDYLQVLEDTGNRIDFANRHTFKAVALLSKVRFGTRDFMELSAQQQMTVLDELNAVLYGAYKTNSDKARQLFADVFFDYESHVAELDAIVNAASKSGSAAQGTKPSLPASNSNSEVSPFVDIKQSLSKSQEVQKLTSVAHTPQERLTLDRYKSAVSLLENRRAILLKTQQQLQQLVATGRTGSAKYNKLKSAEITLSRKVDEAQHKVERVENGITIQKLQENTVAYDKARDIIEQEEIIIGRSVGAKAKNYKVKDLTTGETFYFAEGTKLQDVEVFAGKGANTVFRKAPKYANLHGGKAENWQHVKGFGYLDTPDGEYYAEVHWVQCEGIGKFDFFVKRWIE